MPNPTTTNLILANKIQLGRGTRTGLTAGGATTGPLTVVGTLVPSRSEDFVGFRCVR